MAGNPRQADPQGAQRVILFGGSFNPVHHGHLIVARAVAEHLSADRVILIPSASPPHKLDRADLADPKHRLKMVELAIEGEPRFEASGIEIGRTGPSYSFDTVRSYREELGPDAILYWLIGGDSLPELHTWYRARELVDACTVVTAVRPGYEKPDLSILRPTLTAVQVDQLSRNILPTPRIDISATDIRRRIHENRSIRYLVPERVCDYIARERLYRAD